MNATVKAYAKLNLTLNITGREGGFHMLESLVCSVDVYDLIKLKRRKDGEVSVQMHGLGTETLPPEQNNAYKAALAYIRRFKTCGADVTIYKNIPVGAGMGGSSADAAGVLRGMNKLYGLGKESELKELADGLGSDAGYMLTGGFAKLGGRGEKVEKLDCRTKLDFLLLVPEKGVSAAECYRLYDELSASGSKPSNAENTLLNGDIDGLGKMLCNDLYEPAKAINGSVEQAFNQLKEFAPLGVNMTGSGSGVYALFENAEFCRWAKSRYRGKFDCFVIKSVIPEI